MACLFVVFVLLFGYCACIDLEAHTLAGNVLGTLSSSGTHKVWYIPYAAPPTGQNRWSPPQPVIPWDNETLDASHVSPLCPQAAFTWLPMSEDCLFLSVFVPLNQPTNDSAPALPVQIFVHGGSFTSGGLAVYDGEILSGTDVVVVSINYRLGVLGYLVHSSLSNSANHSDGLGFYGILDQRAAFQWVQDNIEFFGGDPNRVTISGESAGAISVCAHLAAPNSGGLFQQAIMESGFCLLGPNDTSYAYGESVVSKLGCQGNDDEILNCLLGANASALVAAVPVTYYPPALTDELTEQPIDIILSGEGARVPLLIGTNMNESSLFVCPNPSQNNMTATQYGKLVVSLYPSFASSLLETYSSTSYPSPTAAFVDLDSDGTFKCLTRLQADAFSSNDDSPTFMYSFNHAASYFQNPATTKELFQSTPECLGVAHSYELAFLFDLYDTFTKTNLTADELVLRQTMRDAWASFVTTGTPELPNMTWPLYDPYDATYLNIDLNMSTSTGFRADYCEVWYRGWSGAGGYYPQ